MTKLAEFAAQQRAALEGNDVPAVLRLLDDLDAYLAKANSWREVRSNPPQNYDQLIARLEDVQTVRAASGRTEINQLIQVLRWCEAHDIALAELGVSVHLPKYVEAASYLKNLIATKSDAADIRAAIERIKADRKKADTRAWARVCRSA
ncbi:MAG TPA: hypothetical protein PLH19_11430 [Anaerolineae bacterium]|nr:hypothetical protein [Anaerolineae bacterium]HQH39132.1 hypothetical protein [Anaerolineae bacterium]